MSTPLWVPLLESVLRQSPSLPGALCRGRAEVFDADDDDEVAEAVELCQMCPELQRCQSWADTLPANSVHGVVAGRMYRWVQRPSLRRTKAAAS
jgi:hypothetical protein